MEVGKTGAIMKKGPIRRNGIGPARSSGHARQAGYVHTELIGPRGTILAKADLDRKGWDKFR